MVVARHRSSYHKGSYKYRRPGPYRSRGCGRGRGRGGYRQGRQNYERRETVEEKEQRMIDEMEIYKAQREGKDAEQVKIEVREKREKEMKERMTSNMVS